MTIDDLEIAILVPCHKEEVTIAKVVNDFRAQLPHASVYVYDNNSTDGVQATPIDVIKSLNSPLFFKLAFTQELPASYRLIGELRVEDERDFAFARIFEVTRGPGD